MLFGDEAADPDRRLGHLELAGTVRAVDPQAERRQARIERLQIHERQLEDRLGPICLRPARHGRGAPQAERFDRERLRQRIDVESGMVDAHGDHERLAQGHLVLVHLHCQDERMGRGRRRGWRRLRGRGRGEERRDHLRLPRARKSAESGAT